MQILNPFLAVLCPAQNSAAPPDLTEMEPGWTPFPVTNEESKNVFFKSKVHYYYVLGFSLFITLNLRDKNLSDEPKL